MRTSEILPFPDAKPGAPPRRRILVPPGNNHVDVLADDQHTGFVGDTLVQPVGKSIAHTSTPYNVTVTAEVKTEYEADLQSDFTSYMVGNSSAINGTKRLISLMAPTNGKVLLTGETGVGKELAAKDIHVNSKRYDKPFIAVNCAAIPRDTIEAALFGHESGAFTDASKKSFGYFDAAHGGTLFLDEVGELDKHLQAKLARVIEYGTFQRVGGNDEIKVDVRIIAATNKNLSKSVQSGEFTRGLYDRLSVFHINIPPLRERKEDIEPITRHLIEKHRALVPDKVIINLSQGAIKKLENHNWPGNVRELENVIKRAIVLAKCNLIQEHDILLNPEAESARLMERLEDIALSNASVLAVGETGTGKEHLVREIHKKSRRSKKPLVVVNCATLNNSLAESTLFGHTKGAFTGAMKPRQGQFELADGGTIFLDEVGELDLGIQTKLLRVIQEGEIIVMGTNEPKKVNVRVLAATNKDLSAAVKKGEFREDLFHRLNVIPLSTIPLREQKEKIDELVALFLEEFKDNKNITGITKDAMAKLRRHSWPGNIRELKAVIERAIVFAKDSIIQAEDIVFYQMEEPSNNSSDAYELTKIASNGKVHPVLSKYLQELAEHATISDSFDDHKTKLLILKCRILHQLTDPAHRTKRVTEMGLAKELQMSRSTINKLVKRFNYSSTQQLIDELASEITKYN